MNLLLIVGAVVGFLAVEWGVSVWAVVIGWVALSLVSY